MRNRLPSVVLLSSLLIAHSLSAQQASPAPPVVEARPIAVYTHVQEEPHLVGSFGQAALLAAVQQQLVYPPQAKRAGIVGKVFVRLTVDPAGNITDAKVVRGLRPDCDSATLAAVRQLPRLAPARQNGRPVYFGFALPISFLPSTSTGKP